MDRFVRWYFERQLFETNDVTVSGVGFRELHFASMVNRDANIHADHLFMFFPEEVFIQDHESGVPRMFPAHTMIIWPPEGPNCYGVDGRKWEHTWLHCGGVAVKNLLHSYEVPVGRAFSFPHEKLWESVVRSIHLELSNFENPDPQVVLWNLKIFCSQLMRYRLFEDGYHSIPRGFLALKSELEDRYREPLRLRDYTGTVNCSPAHMTRKFKEYFGTTIQEHQMAVRMQHAHYLLQDKGLNISEIAERVGYTSVYSFSKQFKIRFGCSPMQMRRKQAKEAQLVVN